MNAEAIDEKITYYSEELYQYLLKIRTVDPTFTFWLRQRNSTRSKIDRLAKGFWFQGADYIFVSPYKKGDGINKTRSIGFVVLPGMAECALEIAYSTEKDEKFINCYDEIVRTFNAEKKVKRGRSFWWKYPAGDVKNLFEIFITHDKPIIDQIIKKHGLQDAFFITNDEFEKSKLKTDKFRQDFFEDKALSLIDNELVGIDGEERTLLKDHKYRERDRKFVNQYKEKYNNQIECPGCDSDLEKIYGVKAIHLLELHHIVPFCKIKEKVKILEKDVILLCPTCHRAIHKYMIKDKMESITLEEFRDKLAALL